jgi:pyrimidine-nucleoside phosphorylase
VLLPQETIRRKKSGAELSAAEISEFFAGYLQGSVTDYQVTAMLMAVCWRGMTVAETKTLTEFMRDSGKTYSWANSGMVVDKHSTGGVGDKTSIVLLPMCALENVTIPMIAGRGLGHTGGTIDKLASIGFRFDLGMHASREILERCGGVFMGQTDEVAPLDKRLYALRDVTATVESQPLIVASILSKKLAEGLDALVMDVKFGSGAFMADFPDALSLARGLKEVGAACGLPVRCLLTSMDSPLGKFAGNTLEIYECLQIMRGDLSTPTAELVIELGAEMIHSVQRGREFSEIRERLRDHLQNGRALKRFFEVAKAQGADMDVLEHPEKLLAAPIKYPIQSSGAGGWVEKIDVRLLGVAIQRLGGGRAQVTDNIDPLVGLGDLKGVGESVASGEPLCTVYCRTTEQGRAIEQIIKQAYVLSDSKPSQTFQLIRERI